MNSIELEDILLEELGYKEAPDLLQPYNPTQLAINPIPGITHIHYVKNIPVAYFSRLEDGNPDRLRQLHRSIWSESKVPLLYVILPQEIRVYNTYAVPALGEEVLDSEERLLKHLDRLVEVETARQEIKQQLQENYNRLHLETGAFWNSNEGKRIKPTTKADRRLLNSISGACAELMRLGVEPEIAYALVGRSIFIRYLEDRELLTANRISNWTLGRAQSYLKALEDRAIIYDFFRALNRQFNGDLFPPDDEKEKNIDSKHLAILKSFLEGYDFKDNQPSMWPYDFKYVPKELVSGIYDSFLYDKEPLTRKKIGAYYTPLPLVDFVIEETLPLELTQPEMKILDPACGSGVFLVRAYQRLVEAWIQKNKRKPNAQQLSNTLKNGIFGVDIEARSVNIAAFSLYLAMLDYLSNDEIKNYNFRFPTLKDENLFALDFFSDEAEEKLQQHKFDRIVGNPPWGRGTLSKLAKKKSKAVGFDIAGEQLDQAFLVLVTKYCLPKGEIALLAPARGTIHVGSDTLKNFREQFFQKYQVRAVVNFSPIVYELFAESISPCVVLFYNIFSESNEADKLVYCVPKPSVLSQHLNSIVVETTDIKYLDREELAALPELWKIAVWGTPRDAALIQRLKKFPTLLSQAQEHNWEINEGFTLGEKDKKTEKADWLKDKDYIDAKKFKPYYSQILDKVPVNRFHRPRKPNIYQAPITLINRSKVEAIFFDSGFIAYNNPLTGITASSDFINSLKWLTVFINSPLAKYYHFLTSTLWAVERSISTQNEYENMPFLIPSSNKLVEIVDYFDKLVELLKKEEQELFPDYSVIEELKTKLNNLVYEVFDFTPTEIQLVEDTLKYSLGYFEWGKRKERTLTDNKSAPVRPPSTEMLSHYATAFSEVVGTLLRYQQQALNATIYATNTNNPLTVVEFEVVTEKEASPPKNTNWRELDKKLKALDKLLLEQQGETLYMRKQARIYEQNRFYLIRPSEQRFWTPSQARTDADQFIAEQLTYSRQEVAR